MLSNMFVYVWIFSTVLSLPFVGSMSQMGETFLPPVRKTIRYIAMGCASLSLMTTFNVFYKYHLNRIESQDSFMMGLSISAIAWLLPHMAGVIYIIVRYFYLVYKDKL